jgi:predicted nucleotide-binding protein
MIKGKVLIIDDELLFLESIILGLKADGYDVDSTNKIGEAHKKLLANRYDLVVLDVLMPLEEDLSFLRDASMMNAGVHLAIEARKQHSDVRIILYTQNPTQRLMEPFRNDTKIKMISKSVVSSFEFVEAVNSMLAGKKTAPSIFIVHGRDRSSLLELKNYLQNSLSFPEPVILAEQKSGGTTVIEKFEKYAAKIDIAFVLMTPDDVGGFSESPETLMSRARQNVVFELGYFMGMLGRKAGRVIVLHKGPLEIPTDLAGVIYIDISNGLYAAGEEIRRELVDFL